MTNKQIKEEIKQVVTNLGNIKFTIEDELKFCKEVLKQKEQECEMLKIEAEKWESAFTLDTKMLDNAEVRANKLEQQLEQLKNENEDLKEQLITLDDEDVVVEITVKQFEEYKKLKAENNKLKGIRDRNFLHALEEQKRADKYLKTIAEIKGIANKVLLNTHNLEQFKDADALFGALLEIHKKISENEGNDRNDNRKDALINNGN